MMQITSLKELKVQLLPALKDNYIYVLFHTETKSAVVVDPSEASQVIDFLRSQDLRLEAIINTHHHFDHIGGNAEIKKAFPKTSVYAPSKNISQISTGDRWLSGGEELELLGTFAEVIPVPGHTLGHLALHFPQAKLLFSGDTLFAYGCGRLFEGDPAMMWKSLMKLRALPNDTQIYCGHEYTEKNLQFALHIEPGNIGLREELQKANELREQNTPTLPTSLGLQKKLNPFLRADDPELRIALGLSQASATEIFATLRARKDNF